MIDARVRVTVVGGVAALRPAVQRACEVAAELGVPPGRVDDVRLAVHELLLNAHEHGHGGDADIPIDIEVAGSATAVRVHVTDRRVCGAQASEPSEWVAGVSGSAAGVSERGRGLRLAAGLVDDLEVDLGTRRTTVTVVLDLPSR